MLSFPIHNMVVIEGNNDVVVDFFTPFRPLIRSTVAFNGGGASDGAKYASLNTIPLIDVPISLIVNSVLLVN